MRTPMQWRAEIRMIFNEEIINGFADMLYELDKQNDELAKENQHLKVELAKLRSAR